jgi:hypothetical protein
VRRLVFLTSLVQRRRQDRGAIRSSARVDVPDVEEVREQSFDSGGLHQPLLERVS